MDKKEKVIRGLECCRQNTPDDPFQQCGACPYNINGIYVEDCRSVLSGDALEVLKELEALKPTVSVDTWICSKCGHTLESQELIDDKENPQVLIHEQYNYCPNCGRAVKWDDRPGKGDERA